MKIAVVGATGATGRTVVEHALAQGHFVTAVSKVGQTSQYKGVNQEFCAARIGAGGTTISTSPVATS